MPDPRLIAGSGGQQQQAPKQRTPTTTGDNLNSTQYAIIIDALSEGEIGGLVDGERSIYYDNTPVLDKSGGRNFDSLTIETTNGTQYQQVLSLAERVSNEVPVNVTVLKDDPVTRTITDTTVDAVRVTISVPQLQRVEDDGDIKGERIELEIDVQYNGGGYRTRVHDVITGRTTDQYERDYRITFDGPHPVDIRVIRISPDSNDSNRVNAFRWQSYTEITYAKLRYPNTALVAHRFDASQFSNIPTRSYRVRGIKVRVPNNATVAQRDGRLIYSGVWTGVFGAAVSTSDPAWILYDLITTKRYGLGAHITASLVDKWSFYAASQYASALVPDGFGGYEPRFAVNVNIQTPLDAYQAINSLASVMRCMAYASAGGITISQDRPAGGTYFFNQANVENGQFTYASSSLKTRPTVAVVRYFNNDTRDYAYESVEDSTRVAKYGVVREEIEAFACTSRGQARRLGEWLLYSEWFESETITFITSLDAGIIVRPGQIIGVMDPTKAGQRRAGRINSATTTTITVDSADGLPTTPGGTFYVIPPSGVPEGATVTAVAGTTVTVAPAFTTAPAPGTPWAWDTSTIRVTNWRILSVEELDGVRYKITGLSHNPGKYAYIERDIPLPAIDISDLSALPPAPTNLSGQEIIYEDRNRALVKIRLSWRGVPGVATFAVRWRLSTGNWRSAEVSSPDYEILDTEPGTYEVQVYALNALQKRSAQPATLTFYAVGKTANPANIANLTLNATDETSAILSWDRSTELDVLLGGAVLIRHQPVLSGATWSEAQEIVAAASGSQTQKLVPILEGTYLVRFRDDGGRLSPAATSVIVDLPTPQPRLLVFTYEESTTSPVFDGNKTNMLYDAGLDALILAGGGFFDALSGNIDSLVGNWDSLTGTASVASTGEYEFGSTYEFPGVFDVNMRRHIAAAPFATDDLFDDRLGLIDDWSGLFDGDTLSGTNCKVYVRATPDDPSASPTWGPWRELTNNIVRGRGFQFKAVATSDSPSQNIAISELGAQLELQQRTEQSATLTSGTAQYDVVFTNAFYETPGLGITAQNMATGDYFTLSNLDRDGFSITFRNSGGTIISRNFQYTAIGYGKEV